MKRLEFLFVIHNHQPVGNFDSVIEEAYERSYLPFLELLERSPRVRIGLHNSGCLWEWLERHHPEYGRTIERLLSRGQIELLGGGFFEPILPLWPARDRRGQVARMARFLEERFGARPKGIWLAERVWETHLTNDLAAEGVEYLCLDDTQFRQVGLPDEDLKGYLLTEDSGATLGLYPIQMRLRYEIPFAAPEQVIETLRSSADEQPGTMRLFGDDGEKFGIWPGTHKLCYEERWLERFFDLIFAEEGWLQLRLPSEHRSAHPPRGRIYLPAGSYREMTEWALPPDGQIAFEETQRFLRDAGRVEQEQLLLRGGFFRNFLARYPESNQMHKRVLLALDHLERARRLAPDLAGEIRDHFWRAQCNCAYWHGVFGGLYLPHLRDAIYRELLLGEEKLAKGLHGEAEWCETKTVDLDGDGDEEVVLRSDRISLFISPRRGGGILEIDHLPSHRNLINGLARRPEAYHGRLGAPAGADDDQVRTIHDSITAKEEHLERYLLYDPMERLCVIERLFDRPPTPDGIIGREAIEQGDFSTAPYGAGLRRFKGGGEVTLEREGAVAGDPAGRVSIAKTIRLRAGEDRFEVAHLVRSLEERPLSFYLGVEWLLNLLAGHAPDRYVLLAGEKPEDPDLGTAASHDGVESFSLVDHWSEVRIDLEAPGVSGWVRAPLETVSLSESGAERVFQGTIVLPYWRIDLDPFGSRETRIDLRIRHGDEIGAAMG